MEATIKLNTEKQEIEIHFKNRPATTVLDDLKANGFRWGKTNKCWYKRDNHLARRTASKYGTVPEEGHDGGMVQANEDAGADNWARENL